MRIDAAVESLAHTLLCEFRGIDGHRSFPLRRCDKAKPERKLTKQPTIRSFIVPYEPIQQNHFARQKSFGMRLLNRIEIYAQPLARRVIKTATRTQAQRPSDARDNIG